MSRTGTIIHRNRQEHRRELVKLIKQAACKYAAWQVWDDLMYMSAAAIAQPFMWVQAREDEYLRRIGGYDKAIQGLFPLMFAEIVLALEQEGLVDVLGGLYMELELSNHWKAQFFTPDSVCRVIAEMQFSDTAERAKQQGFITVNDPACGGGAMLIAFANVCKEKNVDFQRNVLFVGQDIDPVVARMCFISMSLLGMAGYVIVGDTLLMDTQNYGYWFTPMYFIHGFQWRRQREIVGFDPGLKTGYKSETEEVDIVEIKRKNS